VPVCSGYSANHAHIMLRFGNVACSYILSIITVILAFAFLGIQSMEYSELEIRISDNIFGSILYSLTGFHGFHVVVGLIFLCVQYSRIYAHQVNRDRNLGMCLGSIH